MREKYLAIKRELEFIRKGTNKIRYDDLSQTLQRFYKQVAKKYHERKTQGAENVSDEKLIELYAFNQDLTPMLMQKTFR